MINAKTNIAAKVLLTSTFPDCILRHKRKAVKATKKGIPCSVLYSAPPPLYNVIAKTGISEPRNRITLENFLVLLMLIIKRTNATIPAARRMVKAGLQKNLSPQ